MERSGTGVIYISRPWISTKRSGLSVRLISILRNEFGFGAFEAFDKCYLKNWKTWSLELCAGSPPEDAEEKLQCGGDGLAAEAV